MGGSSEKDAACPSDPGKAAEVERAIAWLASLRDDAPLGVVAAVACGAEAIPALRRVLFTRESSGLYEARRRAVEALAQLRAYEVLIDYLDLSREVVDPVEETGEQALVNAIARALAEWDDPRAAVLLLGLTHRPPLAGVVEALGRIRCAGALDYLVAALAEDDARPWAEAALRNLGAKAVPALVETALVRRPADECESVSSRRRRQSALGLIAELPLDGAAAWPALSGLMEDRDQRARALACRIALRIAPERDRRRAAETLTDLLAGSDFLLREEIGDWLARHRGDAKEVLEREPRIAR